MVFFQVEIANRHETGESPISEEQCDADHDHAAESEETEDETGKEIGKCDALEHAHPAEVIDSFGKTFVNQEAADVNDQAPDKNSFQSGGPAFALDSFAEGEDDRTADHKVEKGEEQI